VDKAKYFVTAADHNPDALQIDTVKLPQKFQPEAQQLSLFTAVSGEL
jgi:hypothetical protein